MPGYKQLCRYCNNLVPPDSEVCPFCGKVNPIGPTRCPGCKSPVQENWKACNSCGLSLEIVCPNCKMPTFFGDYCRNCGATLTITCSNRKCRAVQPPLGNKCIKCGKPLN
jgi:RNA polymerase subunit RPABC4/transcription elongation factor Spt4